MMTGYWDWATFGTVEATALRPGDHDQLVEIASVHGDPADLPILRHWLDRQPEAFTIVRTGSGEILGFVGILLLDAPSSDDLAVDPVVAAAWRHASRNDPPRPGQVIGVNRFFDDRLHGQSTSPTFNVVSWKCTQVWLTTPGLAWFYITVRDEQFWTPMMSYLDFHRVRDADADVGGMRLSAYCRDWRRLGPAAWLDLMEERELGGPIVAPPAPPVLVVLAEDDFAAAVRNALRDLARPDRLTTNPLTASRVVTDQSTHATPADIAEVLRLGLASLPDDPRTDKARRALERTYFHGAVSQETAAEVLGMAFSTYRRHLRAGTDMLIGTLWQWELYGRTP
ncbi:MAG: sigma-70 family RNA polymerase sigma factor [Acidimicrobiales bacterium]|nr:sigma-70 family RNA polymerase sigma factor [Acidimicrobiales bacterium]